MTRDDVTGEGVLWRASCLRYRQPTVRLQRTPLIGWRTTQKRKREARLEKA